MSDCFCTPNYQCLSCERADRKTRIKVERKRPTPRPVAICGTRSGYKRHLKLGEPTCDMCRKAQTEATRKWQKENPLRHNLIKERSKAK